MSHGAHTKESCHTCRHSMLHWWMSHSAHTHTRRHTHAHTHTLTPSHPHTHNSGTTWCVGKWRVGVMTRTWLSHVALVYQSWKAHVTHDHVTHVNTCHHGTGDHVTCRRNISRSHGTLMYESCCLWMGHRTGMSCVCVHVCVCRVACRYMRGWSHDTHMNESWHTHEWVSCHLCFSHVTHMNTSCHRDTAICRQICAAGGTDVLAHVCESVRYIYICNIYIYIYKFIYVCIWYM